METQPIHFKKDLTEDQKLAILTCPGYDSARQYALEHPNQYENLRTYYMSCPQHRACWASIIRFVPPRPKVLGGEFSILGRCLME